MGEGARARFNTAYLLFVAAKDDNRRPTGLVISAKFGLVGMTLPAWRDELV